MNELIKKTRGSEDEWTVHGVELDLSLGSFKFNRSKVLINMYFHALPVRIVNHINDHHFLLSHPVPCLEKENVFQVFLFQTAMYLGKIYLNQNTTTCSN